MVALLVTGGTDDNSENASHASARPTVPSVATNPTPAGPPIPGDTLTIYASVPLQGASGGQGVAIEDGAALALDEAGGRAGGYTVDYKRLDDSLASTGAADEGKAAQNARRAVANQTTIGYIGEYNSGISKVTIPLLNKAGIAQVSPSNTYVGVTVSGAGAEPGEPDKYYPTGRRTYARVVPNDRVQGAALAEASKEAGCRSIHIWDSGTTYSTGLASNVETAAAKAGLTVEGSETIDPKAANYRSMARDIGSDCFLFTGEIESNGVQAITDAAARPNVKQVFAGDGMCLNDTARPSSGLPSDLAQHFKCAIATLDPKALGPEGKEVFARYSDRYGVASPDPYAIYGYESMSVLLDAIERSAAHGAVTREGVVAELFRTRDRASVLGTYSIDANGDTSLTDYGIYKIDRGRLVFDRVVKGAFE